MKRFKRIHAHALAFCMIVIGLFITNSSVVQAEETTTIYFYNSEGWENVNAYAYTGVGESTVSLSEEWPGSEAIQAPEIGENWWSIQIPYKATADTPLKVIFNDGVNIADSMEITDTQDVYLSTAEIRHESAADVENAALNDNAHDDNCEEGVNADLDAYSVSFDGAGAVLPYTIYEAEMASANAQVLAKDTSYSVSVQSEASGRQAVKLINVGEYVEFTLTEAANAMVLRYSMPDSADATLSMYVNGAEVQDLALTSKHAWLYGSYPFTNDVSQGTPHNFFDESRFMFGTTYPAGTKIRLQKDAGDSAANYTIDFMECELVDAALTQPENSLSVLDYGAVANDGQDDSTAFQECIWAAQQQEKEVWIPAGVFHLTNAKALMVNGVTVRGAGMWYTELVGAGAAFEYQGTCKFYDFAMTGASTVYGDSENAACIKATGNRATNVTVQNVWMEHAGNGVWSSNTENLVIQGCRIRNTYAEGINLCSGTNNAMVRNNNLRNTGNDAIAIWPWMGDCTGNVVSNNTVQLPAYANGIAVYGGGNNVVEANHILDTVNNGAGIAISSESVTAKGYTGTIEVKNNLLDRCGSVAENGSTLIEAIKVSKAVSANATIDDNTIDGVSAGENNADVSDAKEDEVVSENSARGFVERMYRIVLVREPDAAGVESWTNALNSGKMDGEDVAKGFLGSAEFANRNVDDTAYIHILYLALFDREADVAGLQSWWDYLINGGTKEGMLNAFINSPEFANCCEENGIVAVFTPEFFAERFVERLYAITLNRSAADSEIDYYAQLLLNGQITGAQAVDMFISSAEFEARNLSNSEYIDVLYATLFNRGASASEKEYWLGVLTSNTRRAVLIGFANSAEFETVCNKYGIQRGVIN